MDVKRRRIALIINSLNGGGAERVFCNLSEEFISQGYQVDLVLMKAEGAYIADIHPEVNLINLNADNIVIAIFRMANYLRRSSAEVLLSTLVPSNVAVIIARFLSRSKTRLHLREANTLSSQMLDRPLMKRLFLTLIIKLLYPLADGHIGISRNVAEDLRRFIGVPRSKVAHIYNPCNLPGIEKLSQEEVGHPWFNDQIPIVIGVGRLTSQKDFTTLIKAFFISLKQVNARLVILGEGEDFLRLEALIHELALKDRVELLGFKKNPYAFMARSSLFVLSSRYEGFGNVLVESLACGLPVISTDCPHGPSEILNFGQFGKLVPVGDVDLMAKAIVEALNGCAPKADANRARAKDFSIHKIGAEYIRTLGIEHEILL